MAWNVHPYSLQEQTAWPVSETATLAADDGVLLPANLLVDLMLRWPLSLGRYAFLASASVTEGLVSLTFQAAPSLDDPGFAPLAALAVARPVMAGRQYQLASQAPGVGGWAVLGPAIDGPWPRSWRFSSPRQTLLVPRAAQAYQELPVCSLRGLGAQDGLTGIVRLTVRAPLAVSHESREIDDVVRDCIVLSLEDPADRFPVPGASAGRGVLAAYAGPCGGRPESRTCGDPQPVEFVNSVGPDCLGVLTLQLAGCALAAPIEGGAGAIVDCNLGLNAACVPPQIPSAEGLLPGEYVPANVPPITPTPTPVPEPASASAFAPNIPLPFAECFTLGGDSVLYTAVGLWTLSAEHTDNHRICTPGSETSGSLAPDDAVFVAGSASGRNVLLWAGDAGAVGRRITTDVSFADGPFGARKNGAIVLNYHALPENQAGYGYFSFELDLDKQALRISEYTGLDFRTLVEVDVPGIRTERWYRLTATVLPAGTAVTLEVTAASLEDATVDVALGPFPTSTYLPDEGSIGLGTRQSLARFSMFQVEEVS